MGRPQAAVRGDLALRPAPAASLATLGNMGLAWAASEISDPHSDEQHLNTLKSTLKAWKTYRNTRQHTRYTAHDSFKRCPSGLGDRRHCSRRNLCHLRRLGGHFRLDGQQPIHWMCQAWLASHERPRTTGKSPPGASIAAGTGCSGTLHAASCSKLKWQSS